VVSCKTVLVNKGENGAAAQLEKTDRIGPGRQKVKRRSPGWRRVHKVFAWIFGPVGTALRCGIKTALSFAIICRSLWV
jgi:hypothetical protein